MAFLFIQHACNAILDTVSDGLDDDGLVRVRSEGAQGARPDGRREGRRKPPKTRRQGAEGQQDAQN